MTKSAIYCLSGAENSKLVISHDDLRSLFNQVEAEFCKSEVYQKAFEGLQKRLGHAPKWVHLLIKAIGREAIRLTLRHVVNQFNTQEMPQQLDARSPQNPQHQAEQHHHRFHSRDSSQAHHSSDGLRNQPRHEEPTSFSSPIHQGAHQRSYGDSASAVSTVESLTECQSADTLTDTPARADRVPDQGAERAPEHPLETVPSAAHSVASQGNSQEQVKTARQHVAEAIAPSTPSAPSDPAISSHQTSPSDQATPSHSSIPIKPSNSSARHSTNPFTKRKSQSPTPPDTPGQAYQEIGIKLKQARLDKSLTVRQVHEQTKVGIHQIEAIERGNLERLPEEIYVKGFIRQVARVVGVEYDALMAMLPQHPAKPTDLPLRYTRIPAASSRSAASRRNVFRPAHLYIGYAALMASATGGLIWASHSQSAAQLEPFDLPIDLPPIDLPQMLDDFKSMLKGGDTTQNQSNPQGQRIVPEAIATPEVITVESSMSEN